MKYIRILFAVLILLVLTVAGASYWTFKSLNTPREHDKGQQFIVIDKGLAPNQIIQKLADEGVLGSTFFVKMYLRTLGDSSKFQAGEYQFISPISPLQVLTELKKGEQRTVKLTIPEGFTRFDIAKRIAEKFPQDPPVDEKTIVDLMNDTTLIRDFDPTAKNLEGYLYPSTYNVAPEATPKEIIKQMVEQFRKIWKPEWNDRVRALGKTTQQIVTIASLIETESKFEDERPIVSSVIYNRLARNVPLGIDQTNVYIAKVENRWDGVINKSDLEVNSPYNTRRFGGIPPGPISSPSESAIKAALNPAQTNYIFYVLNVGKNDGSHAFFADAKGFERAKVEYQKWLEQERAIQKANKAN